MVERERLSIRIDSKGEKTETKTHRFSARINLLLSILNHEIEPAFKGRIRVYHHYNIGARGKAVVNKIINALLELMYENGVEVPMQIILTDYLYCVYSYYDKMNRKPYFTQLSPSVDNMTRFEDWLYEYWEAHDSSYWSDYGSVDPYETTAQAKAALERDRGEATVVEPVDIDIEEI